MSERTKTDVFDRWTPVWHAFFYVMMAVATGVVVLNPAATSRLPVVVLVSALAIWHWVMIVRPGRGHRERPRQVGLYIFGATIVSGVLVAIDLVFLMVAMSLYNQVFAFLTMRRAMPAAAAITASIGLSVSRTSDPAAVIVVVVCAAAAVLLALYLDATASESRKRRELIEELERTREQLALAQRVVGMTEERSRIARELHDTVTQQLVGIVMHLEAANGADAAGAKTALEQSLRLAREGLAEARRLVWAERPAQLEAGSLTGALMTAGERVSKETGLAVEHDFAGDLDTLPAAVQALVLRGVQEALANARKHARARRVTISVARSDDLVTIDVHDDGVGFDPDAARPTARGAGFGLRGLRDRVAAVGGRLSIESAPGKGTTLAVHVPLESA